MKKLNNRSYSSPQIHAVSPACSTNRRKPPPRPTRAEIPYEFTESSVPLLKKYIIDAFKDSAFDKSAPFPILNHKPGHIHLKPNAEPYAVHCPIPVPHHEKEIIKAQLDDYVNRGIIKHVPIGTPVVWCSQMVITHRKDGRPRITIDYQKLNKQCLRETHHSEPLFHLASCVPPGTKKTVLDAVDSYHSVLLDEESQLLTTFITEWGRFMHVRVPQGFIASGDTFTSRYDDIISDVENKVKIIDDTLLHAKDVEESFWSTWDYLTLCVENGVVINESKFQFCQPEVEFAGLRITDSGIAPSHSILAALQEFPCPTNLESARSWFGLVSQVAWAYSISPIMQPFRDLILPAKKFYWDDVLTDLFEKSKTELLNKVREGVKSFQLNRRTCLQTDWCKQGIGYLLLQKYCTCPNDSDVTCCNDGWRLVYAGSRFTKPAESGYSSTEGEALAVAWALEHSRMFTLGCRNLVVSTDHKPLVGLFNDRDLGSIDNPRLLALKQHTLKWEFQIAHNPGKWHIGADAVSRHPTLHAMSTVPQQDDSVCDLLLIDSLDPTIIEARIESIAICQLNSISPNVLISLNDIANAGKKDGAYTALISTIENGFPSSRSLVDPLIRDFGDVRNRFCCQNSVVYMDIFHRTTWLLNCC